MTSKVYKDLGKVVKLDDNKIYKEGMSPKVVLSYTKPNYQDPAKVWEHGDWADKITEDLAVKLFGLKEGDLICVHVEVDEKGYYKLIDVTDAKDVPQKQTKSPTKYKNDWKPGYTKDETGVSVGAAWNNAEKAVEILKMGIKDEDEYITILAEITRKILIEKLNIEEEVRAKKLAKAAVENKIKDKPVEKELTPLEKAKLKAQQAKQTPTVKPKKEKESPPIDDFSDLEDIDFDDIPL